MRRGEIYFVNFDPARSGEANKRRPAIIVSNDGANAIAERSGEGVVTVVPVTGNTARVLAFQVLLPAAATGLSVDAKAQAEQVRSVAVERLSRAVGRVGPEGMARLDDALRLHLDL